MKNSLNPSVLLKWNPDLFGSLASAMCMLHCIATPFVFFVQASKSSCGEIGPWWWHALDFVFLIIGYIAIYQTTSSNSRQWISIAMYSAWFLLVLIIVNAKTSFIPLPGIVLYVPGICLVTLHLYNMKYYHYKRAVILE